MKKVFTVFLMLSLVSLASVARAEGELPECLKKLGQGLEQILKSPGELVETPKEEIENTDNNWWGAAKGFFKAPFAFLQKLGKGAVDVITFPATDQEDPKAQTEGWAKVWEGLKEVAQSPKEVVETPQQSIEDSNNKAIGSGKGILKAPFAFIEQLADGIIDIITFPARSE
ncbi:MAG: hypothetical protein KC713_04255 [Candidatus Omnitrophica bacterium]|nr:hypothetical protein [Candidatus Omnitrophota bacterium]